MTRSWIVGLLLGVSGLFHYASSEASELDHQKTLEETFLETAPASTVRVTKGVYAVDYSSSLKMVHTFGIDGLIYDIENLRQRIANAKSKARDTSALEAAVQVLEGRLEKMQSDSIASKGLRSGSCGQQYDFEMEAYFVPALVGGVTTARVKVEKSPFGPLGRARSSMHMFSQLHIAPKENSKTPCQAQSARRRNRDLYCVWMWLRFLLHILGGIHVVLCA